MLLVDRTLIVVVEIEWVVLVSMRVVFGSVGVGFLYYLGMCIANLYVY